MAVADAEAAERMRKELEDLREYKRVKEEEQSGNGSSGGGGSETESGAGNPGMQQPQQGASMGNADSFYFPPSGDHHPATTTQPSAAAATAAARWAGCRGRDGVAVGVWPIRSGGELERRQREALANNPGSAVHALVDCRTGYTHLVILRWDRVALQHQLACLCRMSWDMSLEGDGPERIARVNSTHSRDARLLCPIELEIHLRQMEHESSIRNAAAAAKEEEQEAAAAAAAASYDATPVEVAACPLEDVPELKAGVSPCIAATVEVETVEELVVVCENADFPLLDEMDVVPSPIFDFGEVHLLEEDNGAISDDSSSGSDSDISSDRSFDSSGNIDQSWSLDLPLFDVGALDLLEVVGELHLLEVEDGGATNDSSSGSNSNSNSNSSGSSDSGEDAVDSDGWHTGRSGGKSLPRAENEGHVLRVERPFDRGRGFG